MSTTTIPGVDEATRRPDERAMRITPEAWGGDPLVLVEVGAFDLPQHHRRAYLTAAAAIRAGETLMQIGREGLLRAAGWLPVEELPTWPEERAVAELARRDGSKSHP